RRVYLGAGLLGSLILLVGGLWAGRAWRRSGAGVGEAGGLDPRRIAVLYFDDVSQSRDLGYLADALTEGLRDRLASVPSLQLISTDGLLPYRHSGLARDSIARALRAGSLIEGSVEQRGDRLVASVRLIDGTSGADIERGSFAHPRGNPLQLRDTLAQQVAAFLRRRLGEELVLRGTLRYWRWLLHLAPDPKEAAALLQGAERDLRAAVGLTPSLASAWSTLSHLDYQKNDITQAKIDAQRAYEEDAYLRVADQVVWRLFTTSYDLEQSQDAIHWCAEGHRRFVKNPKFTQCQLWAMTLRDVAPDIPRAWRVVDELRAISSERQWQFDGPMAQILVAGVLARA